MTTAVIVGTRTDAYPGKCWKRLDAGDFTLDDFDARNIGEGLVSVEVRNGVLRNLTLRNGKVTNAGRVLAMPYADAELDGFRIENVHATEVDIFLRLKKARNGLVQDVSAVGSKVAQNDFPSGCMTSDHPTENITYRRVTMNGFRQREDITGYGNGDGFADEEQSTGMVYEDCLAEDNRDAGLDTKSKDVRVVWFTARRNRRNFRLWGSGTLEDIRSEEPSGAHIWAGGGERLGEYRIVRPVFVGGSTRPHLQVDAGTANSRIVIVDPVLPPGEPLRVVKNETGKLVTVEVIRSENPPQPEPPTPPTPTGLTEADVRRITREELRAALIDFAGR